ncbi:MAG: hypothetical protein ACRD15_16105 [Vicinamibacterales bacterium]
MLLVSSRYSVTDGVHERNELLVTTGKSEADDIVALLLLRQILLGGGVMRRADPGFR